ncbi:MAG: glycosyltransferase [Clostridia bacterium]|nr:glycosyltransferase [Clostridia bacterium]
MSTNIKVSVIMPIYNAFDYLRPAMDTVIDQTLRDIEIICIDDGSTDKSLAIIKEYQERDERIRIVTENNAGISTARNKGIIRARGEFIIFLDADDFYEPTLLEKLYELAVREELDMAVTRFDIFNNKASCFTSAVEEEHGEIFKDGQVASKNEFPDHILQSMTGYVWNKLFRTSFVRDKGLGFAPELYVFEDVHFVCSALAFANRIAGVDEVLVHHRVYSDHSRAKLFRKYYSQVPSVYMKIKEFLMQNGMYVPLATSFLNLSASRCYKIYNLLWSDAKGDFWDMLHGGYADSFGWFRHEAEDFESREVSDFAANVGLYTHSQYLKRLDKGRELNLDKLTREGLVRRIKSHASYKKFVSKLAKIFSVFKNKSSSENDG